MRHVSAVMCVTLMGLGTATVLTGCRLGDRQRTSATGTPAPEASSTRMPTAGASAKSPDSMRPEERWGLLVLGDDGLKWASADGASGRLPVPCGCGDDVYVLGVSPGGRWLAATDWKTLHIANVPAGTVYSLGKDVGADVEYHYPVLWSPRGELIAFMGGKLYVSGPAGPPREPDAGGPVWEDVAWSSDGTQLAVCRGTSLTVVPVDGGAPRRLADLGETVGDPAWSPDGRHIAVVAGKGETDKAGWLALVSAADGRVRKCDELPARTYFPVSTQIVWLPDSSGMLYRVLPEAERKADDLGEDRGDTVYLHRCSLDGNVTSLLTTDEFALYDVLASGVVVVLQCSQSTEGRVLELDGSGRRLWTRQLPATRLYMRPDRGAYAVTAEGETNTVAIREPGQDLLTIELPEAVMGWALGPPPQAAAGQHQAR